MRHPADYSGRSKGETVLLALGYVGVLGLLSNLLIRVGWVHVRLPGLNGYSSTLWKWALGAAVCFALTWYVERSGRRSR